MENSLKHRQDKALALYQRLAYGQLVLAFVSAFGSLVSCFETTYSIGFSYGFVYWLRELMFQSEYAGNIVYNYIAFMASSLLVSFLLGYLSIKAIKAKYRYGIALAALVLIDFILACCMYGHLTTEAYITLMVFRCIGFALMVAAIIAYIRLYRLFAKKGGLFE